MTRSKKSFTELSPAARMRALLLLAASLALVAAAERDIHHRPASEVRGSKPVWRVLCLNALGAIGYFRWGRRREQR
jgi:hypothetical protein